MRCHVQEVYLGDREKFLTRPPFDPTLTGGTSWLSPLTTTFPPSVAFEVHAMKLSQKKSRIAWALSLASLTFVALAHAGLYSIGDAHVSFLAGGPAGLKIEGSGSGLSTTEEAGVVVVTASTAGLKTGISLRDSHLKDAIKAEAHPKSILKVKRSALKFPEDKATVESSASGSMTLAGVTKPVSFSYKVERTGSDYHVQGLTTIDITDFGIEKPCYLGVCVDKDVKVKVKFKVRDK